LSGTSTSAGKVRHITEEFEDSPVEDSSDMMLDPPDNDTNEADLIYFMRMTKHYLHLVNSKESSTVRHRMKFPIIADSGANFHMFKDLEFFDTMAPATGHVILGYGTTKLAIKGIGTVKC